MENQLNEKELKQNTRGLYRLFGINLALLLLLVIFIVLLAQGGRAELRETAQEATPTAEALPELDDLEGQILFYANLEDGEGLYLFSPDTDDLRLLPDGEVYRQAQLADVFSPAQDQMLTISEEANGVSGLYARSNSTGWEDLIVRSDGVISAPAWSPDGSAIVFVTRDETEYTLSIYHFSDERLEVHYAGADTIGGGSWSPDGQQLVFWQEEAGERQLMIYTPETHTFSTLGITIAPGREPVWVKAPFKPAVSEGPTAADALEIWYALSPCTADGQFDIDIRAMDTSGSDILVTRLAVYFGEERIFDTGEIASAYLSESITLFDFEAGLRASPLSLTIKVWDNKNYELYPQNFYETGSCSQVASLPTGLTEALPEIADELLDQPSAEYQGVEQEWLLSDFENKILFQSSYFNSVDLFMMNPDGSEREYVGQSDVVQRFYYAYSLDKVFSPDGGRLVFSVQDEDNQETLYIFDLEQNIAWIMNEETYGNQRNPAWSPMEDKIVYISDFEGDHEMVIYDLAQDVEVRIDLGSQILGSPSWSPQGDWLVFYAEGASGESQIYRVDANGENLTRLSPLDNSDWNPVWLGDDLEGSQELEAAP